jgi:ABC-type sugar transport system ATPase subunit
VLATFLAVQPQFLMFDEPAASIDVGTKRQIIDQIRGLAAEGYAGIFVSSDLQEITDVADRILVLQRGVITDEIDCVAKRPTESDLLAAIQAQAA